MQQRLLLLLLIPLCSGCSNELTPGVGRIVFDDGEPVRSGSIEFRSVTDRTRFSSRIGPGGEFDLADADGRKGIDPGDYAVIVLQIVMTEDLAIHEHTHGHTVPRRYADYHTSRLEYTVAPNQTEPIKIVVGVE